MERPLFSTMLVERRMQLGLSIKQASNVLRLKEDVLIAFEEGDFDSIPKSGYAQGMLSSYARYLGLNAKTVVNQFTEDLNAYENGVASVDVRRRRRGQEDPDGPLYEAPQAMVNRPRRTYVESHGYLPTAGGFAGDMGDFATTSSPRRRMPYEDAADAQDAQGRGGYDQYPQGRPYNLRVPASSGTPLVQTNQRTYGGSYSQGSYGSSSYAGQSAGRPGGSDITTRRVMPSQYQDDMRLDNAGGTYQSASSMAGRRSSRNIASTQRPNVRRRTSGNGRSQGRQNNRGQQEQHGGIVGRLQSLMHERQFVLALIFAILTIVMTVVIISTVHSCVGQPTSERSVAVSSKESTEESKSSSESSSKSESVSKEEEEAARQKAAEAKKNESTTSATQRVIEVSVADGEVTWIEIEYEGKSDFADTVTGPWNRTYTVRQSLIINVNKTAVVTVTENGKKLEFDSKASGLGTITIQVANKNDGTTNNQNGTQSNSQTQNGTNNTQTTAQNKTSDGTNSTNANGTDATTDATGQQTNTQQTNGQNGQTTQNNQGGQNVTPGNIPEGYDLDPETGAYYGADGYYYADGSFHSY